MIHSFDSQVSRATQSTSSSTSSSSIISFDLTGIKVEQSLIMSSPNHTNANNNDFNNNNPQSNQQQYNNLYEQYCRVYEQYNQQYTHANPCATTLPIVSNQHQELMRRYYYPNTYHTSNTLTSGLDQIQTNLNNMNMLSGTVQSIHPNNHNSTQSDNDDDNDEGGDGDDNECDDNDDDNDDVDGDDDNVQTTRTHLKRAQTQNANRKRHPNKGELKCQVCGANANGYNFDAITCESCKAFFRRNAYKGVETFRCLNNQKCVITQATRKKCKRCRIAKCFERGMKKEWIMTENEREEKRRKIEENRKRKQFGPTLKISHPIAAELHLQMPSSNDQHTQSSSNHDLNTSLTKIRRRRRRRRAAANSSNINTSTTNATPSLHNTYQQQQQQYIPVDLSLQNTSTATYVSSYDYTSSQLTTFNNYYTTDNTKTTQMSYTAEINYESYDTSDYTDSDEYDSSEESSIIHDADLPEANILLNTIELNYVQVINRIKLHEDTKLSAINEINNVINVTELAVRRLIYIFKLNDDFKALDEKIQIKLLKGSMMEFLLIHGVMSYDKQMDIFHEPNTELHDKFSAQSIKQTYGDFMFSRIMKVTQDLYFICKSNFLIVKVLFFVVLFCPDRCDCLSKSDYEIVFKLQMKYVALLHQYMRNIFKWPDVELKYAKMILLLSEVNELGSEFRQIVIKQSNPEKVNDLMKEVFLLPPRHQNDQQLEQCKCVQD